MFQDVNEYIKKTRDERRAHLDLEASCIRIGGHASTVFKGLLAHFLNTTIPTRQKIFLCHACNVSDCSNPRHLYWGTPQDNYIDSKHTVFGNSEFKNTEKRKKHAAQMGKTFGGKNRLSDSKMQQIKNIIDAEPKTWGWKQRVSKTLGVSSTQLNRYLLRM